MGKVQTAFNQSGWNASVPFCAQRKTEKELFRCYLSEKQEKTEVRWAVQCFSSPTFLRANRVLTSHFSLRANHPPQVWFPVSNQQPDTLPVSSIYGLIVSCNIIFKYKNFLIFISIITSLYNNPKILNFESNEKCLNFHHWSYYAHTCGGECVPNI